MCLTGGFALAMAVDDDLLAPVLSQPSLPLPARQGSAHAALGLSDADLARVKDRVANENLCVLGLRFSKDRAVPDARWARYKRGARRQLHRASRSTPRPAIRTASRRRAHSVLTEHLVDQPGHPTKDALDRVLAFFRDRLTS